MKAVLAAVNAKYIHSNPAVKSIFMYSADLGDYMEVCEYTINQENDHVLSDLYGRKPDLLCFSCYLWNIDFIKTVIIELKKLLPGCEIWLGGPEVSFNSDMLLEQMQGVKGIMYGEGELVFRNLLREYISGKRNFINVKGLCFRENEKIIKTPPEKLLDMDSLPFVYGDIEEFSNRIIYYESSRGCPFGCSYCMSSVDKSVRFRSLRLVLPEIQHFLDNHVPQVKFVDRTFNIQRERTETILRYILEHDNGVTNFHFEIAADIITDSEAAIMEKMRPGLIQLEIGVQTTNPDTMSAINRKAAFDKICDNVNKIHDFNNIHQHLDLIAGLPLENLDSFKRSFNDVYSLRPEQLQLGFLKVLKGAPMENDAKRYGIVYRSHAPYEVLYTDSLSFDDVLVLKGVEEMTEVYYNSGLFANTLRCLELFHKTPFDMFDELWKYYVMNNLNNIKHSRITRYMILHDYIHERLDEENAFMMDEALIYDLYLKENLKTRPSFSMPVAEYKKVTTEIYRIKAPYYKGKDFHIEPFNIDTGSLINGKLKKRKIMVLFDYSEKNPLAKTAKNEIIHEGAWENGSN